MINKVHKFAEKLLLSMNLELVEVEFRMEGHGQVLRIFIDGPNGITVDHCADVSREINVFLDVEDLIPDAYHLEVSSPGLERPLRNAADFKRFAGKKARVKLRHPVDGQKVFTGLLGDSDENGFELILEDKEAIYFQMDNIRKARLSL